MQAALDELYGFGYDYQSRVAEKYNAVTPDDVLRVAKKYLTGGYVTTVATPKPALLKNYQPGKPNERE
jgi:predicted Zn-dependent peptidase